MTLAATKENVKEGDHALYAIVNATVHPMSTPPIQNGRLIDPLDYPQFVAAMQARRAFCVVIADGISAPAANSSSTAVIASMT